ncbi:Protein TIFY 10A [Abeliophyllum distichum]|uniref:Protein TIFY n=1 Tax=Abeliophyllum distichum TaxID=126358 RepID=A0ABD1V5R3_9LAMI
MGSSELLNSGRFSRHYLGGKDNFGNLSLGLTQDFEPIGAPNGTMNLLSTMDKSGAPTQGFASLPQYIGGYGSIFNKEEAVIRSDPETAQMTIIYAGQVFVFNDFPVDKANEIMMLATAQNHPTTAVPPSYMVPSPAESTTNISVATPISNIANRFDCLHYPQPSLGTDLPMARKNSLARFLEKRKNRIAAKTPYQASKQKAAPRHVKGEAWLGLAPQFPFQI